MTEDAYNLHTLSFRVSFYDVALDRIMAPLTFSERKQVKMSPGEGQDNLENVHLHWKEQKLPTLRTARNKLSLIRQSRLSMFIYASGHPKMSQETLIGQVSLPLGGLTPTVSG